ncbi:hypothetical protein MKQ70_18750 [Chitinophaga sedimenti]|nr:hypothetical protein [Chitinophaga sedimenti]
MTERITSISAHLKQNKKRFLHTPRPDENGRSEKAFALLPV